jgi:hypothetical protein
MNKFVFQILMVMAAIAIWIPAKAEIIYSDSDTMDIAEVHGQPGETVDVMIDMANPSFEVAGVSHRIIYDQTLLAIDTAVCIDRGCNLETFLVNFSDPGVIWIAAITSVSNPIPVESGPVIAMSFIINGNAPETVTAVSFENTVFHDNAWSDTTGYDLIIPILVDGGITIGSQTGVGNNPVRPEVFELSQNYPNPFNGETKISFTLPRASQIDLCVYDLIGRKVATLYSGQVEAGETEIGWDARTTAGAELPSGIYFYRLAIAEGKSLTRRMTLLK